MILSIYRDPKFTACLDELRRQGGVSSGVAKKADAIIDKLRLKARDCAHELGRLTTKGELRIKRCKKYDLGNGYRLVCQRHGHHLILLYIGTHDECSRWLDRNKGLKYDIDETNGDFLPVREIPFSTIIPKEEKDPAVEYEEQLMKHIDDNILRKIFCGICEK
jgi:hypothetical protein